MVRVGDLFDVVASYTYIKIWNHGKLLFHDRGDAIPPDILETLKNSTVEYVEVNGKGVLVLWVN